MKTRPILFSGPMVRALLDGSKTQTRRVIVPQPYGETTAAELAELLTCRIGQVGDRLWVRETWAAWPTVGAGDMLRVQYAADGTRRDLYLGSTEWTLPKSVRDGGNAPSIFMPRWASRLTLEITDVHVERLQAISEADALAEGVFGDECVKISGPFVADQALPSMCYANLWDSLNAKRGFGWDTNPFVWAISFRRVDASLTPPQSAVESLSPFASPTTDTQ